jgi:uncharacterized protein
MATASAVDSPAPKQRALAAWFRKRGSVLIGFSGGVDSAYLAVAAVDTLGASNVLAVLGVSGAVPLDVHDRARRLADDFGVPFREVATHELDDADYVANRGDRCYFCKRELWHRLVPIAHESGLATIADGTIAEDLQEHRPGHGAGVNAGVDSPLAECGFTKFDVRSAARARGIPLWDAPASPCLASRLAVGVTVTAARLASVEHAEAALRALGVTGDLRVRHLGDAARVELLPAQIDAWLAPPRRAQLASAVLGAGFARVLLDLRGYRRGALQEPGSSPMSAMIDLAGDTPAVLRA